jgi:hypothetical protein
VGVDEVAEARFAVVLGQPGDVLDRAGDPRVDGSLLRWLQALSASIHRRGWRRYELIVSIIGDPVGVRESPIT